MELEEKTEVWGGRYGEVSQVKCLLGHSNSSAAGRETDKCVEWHLLKITGGLIPIPRT